MKTRKIALALSLLFFAASSQIGLSQAAAGADSAKAPTNPTGLDASYMDTSADPCVNFYQYACGNFEKVHPIPSDHPSIDTFTVLFDQNQEILHAILEKAAAAGTGRSANEQKIGDYYATCMDADAIDKAGLKPLQPELDRIAALKDKRELTDLIAHFQLMNVNAFFGFGEQQDFADARKQIAIVAQGGLGLPDRDYYLRTGEADEKIRQQYVEHIAKMLNLTGEPEAKAASDAKTIMDLETTMAKSSLDLTARREPKNNYHISTVAAFQKEVPAIDWKRFIKATGAPEVTELNVAHPDFFKELESLLQSTSLDTIKTYLRWQLINSMPSTTLPKALDAENFNFNGHILSGTPEQEPRWKRCVGATDGALGEALGQVYAAQEFPPSSKAVTVQMVHDIEMAMDSDIDTLDWMSAETKVKAKEKLHAVANKIGYPAKWRDYSSLKVVRGDMLGNAMRAVEFENHRQLDKIGKPVDRDEFGMSPPTVNAYYNGSMNDINFPAGILQPPFYDSRSSDVLNYGHIGSIEGHELTHGFDDQGRKFDGSGNLREWWTEADEKKFEERTDCEVKEYSDFTVGDGVHVNGKQTLGENTADNGGLRLAYIAMLAEAKRKSVDLSQKQDGYTPAQQFFVAYAQNWCSADRPEALRMQARTDFHSPDQFRVNGVVRNMTEFGEAFGCKKGQPMMPENACRVW